MLRYSRVRTTHGGIDDHLAWGLLGRRKDESLKRLSSGAGSRVHVVFGLGGRSHSPPTRVRSKHEVYYRIITGVQPCTSGPIVEPQCGLGMI